MAGIMEPSDISRPVNFCQTCAVRNRAICADLDDGEIGLLNSIGRRRKIEAGEQLLWEGDDAVLVANVIEGVLKLSSETAGGKEQILGLAYPSDFLGRPFGETNSYGVEALVPTEICVFYRADFDRFAREHPKLEHRLLERTLSELDRTRRWMLLLGRMNAEQKLASFLLETAERLARLLQLRGRGAAPDRTAAFAPADRRRAGPDHRNRQPPVHAHEEGRADRHCRPPRCHHPRLAGPVGPRRMKRTSVSPAYQRAVVSMK